MTITGGFYNSHSCCTSSSAQETKKNQCIYPGIFWIMIECYQYKSSKLVEEPVLPVMDQLHKVLNILEVSVSLGGL
jgi:hypothetical protein